MTIPTPRKTWSAAAVLALATAFAPGHAEAKVTPHPLFSEGAVLQRDRPITVWGVADEGETVTVKLQGQSVSTLTKQGKWLATLKPLEAGGPFTLSIEGDADADKGKPIEVKNVLVGEVWVCSGQSNMAWSLAQSDGGKGAIAASTDPMLRLFTVPRQPALTPQTDITAEGFPLKPDRNAWKEAGPTTTPSFSAVAYYFGRDLRKALGVPVGLINTSYGGTPAEAWTPRQALESDPALAPLLEADARATAAYPAALEKYETALKGHKAAQEKAKAEGKPAPRGPGKPQGADSPQRPTVLYNNMIAPIVPYGIAGAIWYQGESNAGQAYLYQRLFSTMITSWRAAWGQGDFPFLLVQLAPFMKIADKPGPSAWAELREAQLKTAKSVAKAGMAVITDVGEEDDIHPRKKEPVGARLAIAARAIAYGEKVEYSGPEYVGLKIDGGSAVLSFAHTGGGLEAKGGELKGFAIAGDDHAFVNAEAKVDGETVVVRSPEVSHPTAVRYGWANFPLGNLWNKAGLPASPFRTDDLPMTTMPRTRAGVAR